MAMKLLGINFLQFQHPAPLAGRQPGETIVGDEAAAEGEEENGEEEETGGEEGRREEKIAHICRWRLRVEEVEESCGG